VEFVEFVTRMEETEQGRAMLVYVTDTLRAFVPMPEPPPRPDPWLEQQWADDLLYDIADAGLLHRLPPGVFVTREEQVIVFSDAGEVIPT
jgi:hypothetical protein